MSIEQLDADLRAIDKDAELTRLRAELEKAKEALRPFAEFTKAIDSQPYSQMAVDSDVIHPGLTVGHFRAAARFLSKTDETNART